jgi:hypothetical protein
MQHLTVDSKDLLIGDEAAEALTEYAALVAKHGTADRVKLRAFGSDGDEVTATIVLSAGTTILTETSHNSLPEPENGDAIAYIREQIRLLVTPPPPWAPETEDEAAWEAQLEL